MASTLSSLVAASAPNTLAASYTTPVIANQIRLTLNHPNPKVWVVVEGDDDVAFYSKCLDPSKYSVHISSWQKDTDTNPSESCENVEAIVREVIDSDKVYFKKYLIGIRDKDYTPYLSYTKPDNVFLTDYHSFECYILSELSIQNSLNKAHPGFANKLNMSTSIAKDFAIVRIHNTRTTSGIAMSKALSLSELLDNSGNPKTPWPDVLVNRFNSLSPKPPRQGKTATSLSVRTNLTLGIFNNIKTQLNGECWNYCQGHDLIRLLNRFVAFGNNKKSEDVKQELLNFYNSSIFEHTQLYADIENWYNSRLNN